MAGGRPGPEPGGPFPKAGGSVQLENGAPVRGDGQGDRWASGSGELGVAVGLDGFWVLLSCQVQSREGVWAGLGGT